MGEKKGRTSFLRSKFAMLLWPFTVLFGCKQSPFTFEPNDRTSLVHSESGLYVHREVELRVNAARLEVLPEGVVHDARSRLDSYHFFPYGTGSTSFNPTKFERQGEELVWKEVIPISKDGLEGKIALGACVKWEKDGVASISDVLELFPFPPPDTDQIDVWSPWIEADRRREGDFGWHAEANKKAEETVGAPVHPFQMRFRLVLSRRMYP